MVKSSLNDLFGSLSDNTRRDMLQRLLHGEQTITQLAASYNMSLVAVSKHLKVLEASKLITKQKRGRQWFVALSPAALKEVKGYVSYYEAMLHNRLDSFAAYVGRNPIINQDNNLSAQPRHEQQAITIDEILDASPEAVWKEYVDPASIKVWWKLPGTQLERVENDVRVGGVWRFTVRGLDGRKYIVSGKYQSVEFPYFLKYTDGMGESTEARPEACVTITFKQLPDGKTHLIKTSLATPAVHQLNAAWHQAMGGG